MKCIFSSIPRLQKRKFRKHIISRNYLFRDRWMSKEGKHIQRNLSIKIRFYKWI